MYRGNLIDDVDDVLYAGQLSRLTAFAEIELLYHLNGEKRLRVYDKRNLYIKKKKSKTN